MMKCWANLLLPHLHKSTIQYYMMAVMLHLSRRDFTLLLSLSVNISEHSGLLIITFYAVKPIAVMIAKSNHRLQWLFILVAMATFQDCYILLRTMF